MSREKLNPTQLSEPVSSSRISGSPFVVGRPLRADEPIFGREEAFRFIESELATLSSINIIGERRMGKTSLLNHLIANRAKHFTTQLNESPFVLAHIDLQREVSTASRFYAAVLRDFLARLPSNQIARARKLADLNKRLNKKNEVAYDEFEQAIRELLKLDRIGARPVIVIDEFEYLLEPSAKEGFPYPGFFNGLRSLIGDKDKLLAMIVASRRPLAEYFSDPVRPGSLTSTFPTYFQPFTLEPLDDTAADELLLQKSDHALKNAEAEEAKQWAKGHPCHLQVAGAACYQAKAGGRSAEWAYSRREELKSQNCMVSVPRTSASAVAEPRAQGWSWRILRYLSVIFWSFPLKVGQLVQRLGVKIDDVAAWLMGFVLIVLLILLALGVLTGESVWSLLKKYIGAQSADH